MTRIAILTLILVGATGCVGAPPDNTNDPEGCEALDVTACAQDATCATINGRALQDDGAGGECVDFSVQGEPLGCMADDVGCGDAETLAAPPGDADSCTWFSSTCVPAGWVSCGDVADECAGR